MVAAHKLEACFSSESVEHSTPDDLFTKLNQEFHFVLDAAAADDESPEDFLERRNAAMVQFRTQVDKMKRHLGESEDEFITRKNRTFTKKLKGVQPRTFNAKCERYYTVKDDGLVQSWQTHEEDTAVWCNPPYGREISAWVSRAAYFSRCGQSVVMLLPARTDTKWWHDFIWDEQCYNRPRAGVEVRFIKGRLKFGGSKNSAPFPSVIVIFHGVDS